ncbi:hypothetical protein LCER1_G005869 [Lachnellula cervina]|uniref:Uncharacterized protein n=1 Tax=Lachnellula cervina TaxID=1316786 RepID=A0A7D8UP90_9HELO|nr:hypothetical protein LCER1_G005869 [Lachnellula cervina]
MSASSESSSPPKRPRLSLQIKTPSTALTYGKSSTALKADVDPSSPTAFNTLSNAYAAAIENSSPRTARPISSTIKSGKPTSLRLETKNAGDNHYIHPSQRTQTPGPFSITYPDTPSSAISSSASISESTESQPPASSFTFTPPQSAGTTEQKLPSVFTFAANAPNKDSPSTPRTPRRRATFVGYNDPLTQTITTNKYVKSHIDLLSEESPYSAADAEKQDTLDLTFAYTGDETRDGGQTPGPFEEMRRRMAESELETPATRKRKRKEKKRKWEWTITSTEGDDEEERTPVNKTPLTAVRMEKTPNTAIWRGSSVSTTDSEMSDVEEGRFVGSCIDPTDSEMSSSDDQRPGSSQSL